MSSVLVMEDSVTAQAAGKALWKKQFSIEVTSLVADALRRLAECAPDTPILDLALGRTWIARTLAAT
jgi:ActR/RegA family two-component response regulator